MTVDHYTRLPKSIKASLLFRDGVSVGRRTSNQTLIFLYQLHSFYVEVFYNSEMNKVEKIKPFDETTLLEPYIKKIDLSALGF